MENSLQNSNIDTLREAFPTLDPSIIDDVLYSVKGDLNMAFEMLLDMNYISTDESSDKPLPYTPPLPARAIREELAQWRQDLREESRRRSAANVPSSVSTLDLSCSNMLRSSNSTGVSLANEQNNRSNTQANFSFQPPLPARPSGNISGISFSASTPNVNYHQYDRGNGLSNDSTFMPSIAQRNHSTTNMSYYPALPSRRQSSTSNTNPFHENSIPQQQQQQGYQRSSNHRASSENDIPSVNPFEEPELPPPAYNEIQRDTIINLI
ncbi:hypothetical protein [Parasitella parasitica]|uniref:CUE domain-containing protein n=1 Tax=Parasitella parasitica TaxID=35722 RepID=A0A0B7NCI0_9FUNG|nr:hypothetical protein [Parasitella parasitica]